MKLSAKLAIYLSILFFSALGSIATAQSTQQDKPQNEVQGGAPELTPEQEQHNYNAWAQELWDSLDKKRGQILIPKANAVLDVPENFIYLDAKDAETVLVDAWGNMPSTGTLGMLMPANMTAFDYDSWAVTIEYSADGYVSDEDAADIDYEELLEEVKNDTAELSKERLKQGYESIEMIGWASQPYYDVVDKKLHWAKEIKFGGTEPNTLNYNIRILGRKGVLVLNFIANMDQKAQIDAQLSEVLAIAQFDQDNQYADFNPDTDNYAAYGIGALITGKVLAKTGFLAIALVFLKKFGVFILIGAGALVSRVYKRKKNNIDE